MPEPLGFEVRIVHTNVLNYSLDVFVLIYPQEWTTLGQAVVARLPPHSPIVTHPPHPGKWKFVPSNGAIKASSILSIGAPPFNTLNYDSIRQVGRQIVVALAESAGSPPAGHVGVTIFGPGGGLDEVEAMRALLFGFMAAIEDGITPVGVHRVSIVENHIHRFEILTEALDRFWQKDARTFAASLDLPEELIADADEADKEAAASPDVVSKAARKTAPGAPSASGAASKRFTGVAATAPVSDDSPPAEPSRKPIVLTTRTHRPPVPIASLSEPSIFVAMPFAARYNDVYYYAMLPAIKANHYQCIRLDKVIYTGSVIDTIKKRIASAKLMIALVDSLNPNVFLEIGYAWGVETPVLLLVSDDQFKDKLPFDVASYRYLVYDSIRQLAARLPKEIKGAIDGSEVEE